MASPTGFSTKTPYRQTRVSPAVAGGHVLFGDAAIPARAQAAKGAVRKLGWWETVKAIATQMKDPETQKVSTGLALKYLPDLTMSSLFAIPVLGWAAGIVAIPFSMFLTSKGEKIIAESRKDWDKKKPLNSAIHHTLNMEKAWASEDQYFGKVKPNKPRHELSEYVAIKYNKAIQGLFRDRPDVQAKLSINYRGNGWAFWAVRRVTHARQALRQTKFIGWIFNKMSGLSGGNAQKVLPKPLQLILLLPRMGLLGIYVLLGCKPKFKLPVR
jgi:hypothetical protein